MTKIHAEFEARNREMLAEACSVIEDLMVGEGATSEGEPYAVSEIHLRKTDGKWDWTAEVKVEDRE